MATYTVKVNMSSWNIQDMFKDYDRSENFSNEGLEAILEMLEETSENEVIDLDVIGICCEYSEQSPLDIINDYRLDLNKYINDEDEADIDLVHEYLNDNTWAVIVGDNIVYQNF